MIEIDWESWEGLLGERGVEIDRRGGGDDVDAAPTTTALTDEQRR